MNSRRLQNASTQGDRNNQKAIHLRYKNTIAALNDLMKDAALIKHRKTLDEVARAVTRAIESDEKWSTKCQELQTELTANESKIKIAMQLSEEDKSVIETLKNELQKERNTINDMKLQNCSHPGYDCFDKELERMRDIHEKVSERDITLEKGDGLEDRYKLLNEIEKGKLLVFELEEELANKEKSIEELMSTLNSKSRLLEDVKKENEKLKIALDKNKSLINSTLDKSSKKIDSDQNSKSNQIIATLKKKLQDIDKIDQLSFEKVKHLIKINKTLNRQLQIAKNQNNLMKLELAEKTKMLDLLSYQCCKLEEKDKKQNLTITALLKIRDKYVQTIGNLEQEMHDIKNMAHFQKST